MEDAGFILGSYVLTFAAAGLFALRTIRSGRRLAHRVPDDEKYWLSWTSRRAPPSTPRRGCAPGGRGCR